MAESREHRTQGENKKAAFRRMASHWRFRAWVASFLDPLPASERSVERIRTYDMIANRVKDHRTGRTAPIGPVLDGNLDLLR